MPCIEEHCQDSLRKYGKRFEDLHIWMDEHEISGKKHRMYRHDPKTTPQEARKLFGEDADHACLDHILLDYPELIKGKYGKVVRWRARKGIIRNVLLFVVMWTLVPLLFGFLLIPNFHEWIFASDFPWNILKMIGGGLLVLFLLYLGWFIFHCARARELKHID